MQNMFSKLVDFMTRDKEIPVVDTHWFSESGIIDCFVLLGPKPSDVFRQYASLTGTTQLPPVSFLLLLWPPPIPDFPFEKWSRWSSAVVI